MRSDKHKQPAQQKESGKREQKDVEDRRSSKTESKQGHPTVGSGEDLGRRRYQKGGHTLH